jgi:hypothetical protein
MSYHIHNLEPGNVFYAPLHLEEYGNGEFDERWEYFYWEVISCKKADDNGWTYNLEAFIHVSKDEPPLCRAKLRVGGDISICDVDDFVHV